MKFYRATTRRPVLLASVFGEGRHLFATGTEASATQRWPKAWHLNAELDGEMFEGLAVDSDLEVSEVIATCNEG